MASFEMNNVMVTAIQGNVVGSCLGWYFMKRPCGALRVYVMSCAAFLVVSLACDLVIHPDRDIERTVVRALWLSLIYAVLFGTFAVLEIRRIRRRQADPS